MSNTSQIKKFSTKKTLKTPNLKRFTCAFQQENFRLEPKLSYHKIQDHTIQDYEKTFDFFFLLKNILKG